MPRRPCLVLLPLALLAAGCDLETETTTGDTTVVHYQTWVPVVGLLVGLAAIPVGLVVRRRVERLGGWFILVGIPLLAVLFVPIFFTARVTVTPDGFSTRGGAWFRPKAQDVRFDDVTEMSLTAEEKTGRRGRKTVNYHLECRLKNGVVVREPVGELMRAGGLDRILDRAEERGIPVVDRRGGL